MEEKSKERITTSWTRNQPEEYFSAGKYKFIK
jgi:hypothetical protein